MGRLKTFRNYIIYLIGIYIFSMACMYIGFNATYRNIGYSETIPDEITVEVAQSTKVNGRIYGKVKNTEQNDLNGKYIKVQIFSKRNELLGAKYLQISDIKPNETKKFKVNFTAENVKYYSIDILEDNEETQKEINLAKELWDKIFTEEELKGAVIVGLIIGLSFGF